MLKIDFKKEAATVKFAALGGGDLFFFGDVPYLKFHASTGKYNSVDLDDFLLETFQDSEDVIPLTGELKMGRL